MKSAVAGISGLCPDDMCMGSVFYEPDDKPGMRGECDTCGAQFRLMGGQSIQTRPPKPLDNRR